MNLYFLRHGEADWPGWDKPDDARPLTKRGIEEMEKIAAFLARLDFSLDRIVTSPLPRAEQTARIVAEELDVDLQEDHLLKPGFGLSKLKQLLKKYADKNLMIVGHEPDFTETISGLTGARLKLSKAGLALVELETAAMR
ncbi:MAG: phosphohistidine phosphatase, partial [Verrucomicrobiota bacterium]